MTPIRSIAFPLGLAVVVLMMAAVWSRAQPTAEKTQPRYVGVMECASCHKGPMMGYQFSRWRLSEHARAYAVLALPKARQAARKVGIETSPQSADACLRCHVTAHGEPKERLAESFELEEGVQCESCHGAGSEYVPEAVMRDHVASRAAGLKEVTKETCTACHNQQCPFDEKKFDHKKMKAKIAHPTKFKKPKTEPQSAAEPRYKTPVNLALSPDGRRLYVVCEASDSLIVVHVATGAKIAETPVGRQPHDVTTSPDGKTLYVTNRMSDSLSVVDAASLKVTHTIPVGDEPHGVLTDKTGRWIYVLNTATEDISVIDATSLREVKRLAGGRGPWSLAISPDGKRILATNTLSQFVPFRTPPMSEITVIDAERAVVTNRYIAAATNLLQGVAFHPGGRFALVTLLRTKNLVPMTRLMQGWTITNGLGVVWADGRVDQALLDEPNAYFPDPADVAVSPDGRRAYFTSSGSDCVAVVDVDKLIGILSGTSDHEREHVIPNHLGKSTEFVIKRVATRDSPRGLVVSHDNRFVYVANALDDSITVIDAERLEPAARIELGGPQRITQARWGEKLFHSANITFQRQFSCHTCHPDGHVDGITYDIEPDGIGISPVDNRTLRGILDTAPFKWEGTNPSLQRQCGPRLAVFFTRIQPFTSEELAALDRYICTIPRPPNRYRLGDELTPAQRRGKAVFERTMANTGEVISVGNRCITCHPPPYYTDRRRHDVGTRMAFDRESRFDAPHLNNIYDSAPYLHNGVAPTLEEIWTRYNPYDRHGVTNDMTKDQLNDLIEYLKTL